MKKLITMLLIISLITITAFGLTGTYSPNDLFYKPGYGESGKAAFDEYETYIDIADAQIKANKDAFDEFEVSDITDVDLTDIANTKILKYNSTTEKWECEDDASASGAVDTSGTPVQYDIARFTDLDTIEGRSYAEFKADLDLEIGTDVLAQQSIGIIDNYLLEVDGLSNANEYARFTANGLVGRTEAEFKGDFNLEIGTDVEAHDDGLLSIAGLTTAANKSIYTTALDTYAVYDLTAFGRSILDDADEATFKATVNLEIGTDVEVDLSNEAGLYAVLSDVSDFVQSAEANSIDSVMYVDSSIDHEHLAPDVITGLAEVTSTDLDMMIVADQSDSWALKKVDMGEVRGGGAGGSAITFDIGDDGGNDSVDVNEIATTGDTNSIFTEPTADKILIALANNWPGADLATLATTITVTDNENTAENNPICFVAGADPDGGSLGIETDGTCYYTPSTGKITTTGFVGALTGNVTGTATGLVSTSNADITIHPNGTGDTRIYAPADVVTTVTAAHTMTIAEAGTVLVSCAATPYTITLPTAVGHSGLRYHFIKTDANYFRITLDGNGAETLNYENYTSAPAPTYIRLNTLCAEVTIVSDNSNWQVINEAMGQVPTAHAYLTAEQTNISGNTWVLVNQDSEVYDIGGNFNTTTDRFVCPVTGKYQVTATITWKANDFVADKEYKLAVYKNAAGDIYTSNSSSLSVYLTNYINCIKSFSKDDYLQMYVKYVDAANTQDIKEGAGYTEMVIRLIEKD